MKADKQDHFCGTKSVTFTVIILAQQCKQNIKTQGNNAEKGQC